MHDQHESDEAYLASLGYAQQLFREMGGFSNFAISLLDHLDPHRRRAAVSATA